MEKNTQMADKDQYKQLADAGDTDAMVEYSLILCREGNKEPEEAVKYLKMAVDKGNAYGMTYYAKFLQCGFNIEKNLNEAEKYFLMAIEKETIESRKAFAEYSYAEMLYNDCDRKKEAVQYYKMAADRGNIEAMKKYSCILYKGMFSVKPNKQEATKYYKMLIDSGKSNTTDKYYYAKLLYAGYGGEENVKEAEKYFKLAADEGDVRATYFYYALIKNESKEYVASQLFNIYEKDKENFTRELTDLMKNKNITKRKNIDFTIPVNNEGDNLIDLLISSNILNYKNTALINNLKFEELATIKKENIKKLVEYLAEIGKDEYFEKFFNDKRFLTFENENEEYEFKVNLIKLAFRECNYGMVNFLINSMGGIDKIKNDSITEILNTMQKNFILDSDLYNLFLNKVENKEKYLEKVDNLYEKGRNGYGQIKLTREFNENNNPVEIIDSGWAHLNGENSDKTIVGPKLYEVRYKNNSIREITYYDKDTGKKLAKMIIDDKNQINTFDFKETDYENIEILDEEKRKVILQNFRDKVDSTIASDFVNIRGFDNTLANLAFTPIALEDKIYKKSNPIIFQDFNSREKMAEIMVESIDNPEQEYILGISNDNHRTVMVLSNGKAILINTSGDFFGFYEYFTKDIQKMAREKYKESHEVKNEAELKEKIKIREVRFVDQVTGNCTLVGNVKTAVLLEKFNGDYKKFVDFSIKLTKLAKDNKKLSDVIDINNEDEFKNIETAAKKFSEVAKSLTNDKNEHYQLINDSEGFDKAIKKIEEFKKSKDTNISLK